MSDKAAVIARWVVRLALVCVLGAVTFAVVVLVVLPRAVHGTPLTVLTGSMSPDIPVGSVVIDRPVDPGTLHVGDIATYQENPGQAVYITHRIVKIDSSKSPTMFTFKGDANRGPDMKPVPATAIRGKVWIHVPHLGSIRDAIHTKGGLEGAGMLVLAIYALVQLGGSRKEAGSSKRPAKTDSAGALSTAEWNVVREQLDGHRLDSASPSLVLVTLPTAECAGLSPEDVSQMLGGTLVEVNDTSFTVLAVEEPARRGAALVVAHEAAPAALKGLATINA